MQTTTQQTRGQQGFTLVELAIVLVIVGLLIGGVLKGQELIENTRVTTTVAQVKGLEAGMNTFYDTYGTLPGDLLAANTRLPSCTAANGCQAGNGNNLIDNAGAAVVPGTIIGQLGENSGFFIQLGLADVLDGVNTLQTPAGGGAATWRIGEGIYGAKIANAHFRVGYSTVVANLTGVNAVATPKQGHYLLITGSAPTAAVAAADVTITPSQGLRIDRKYDDGKPLTGTALAGGAVTNAAAVPAVVGCVTAAAQTADYDTQQKNPTCAGIYLRIGA